jgi:hypothetical protein
LPFVCFVSRCLAGEAEAKEGEDASNPEAGETQEEGEEATQEVEEEEELEEEEEGPKEPVDRAAAYKAMIEAEKRQYRRQKKVRVSEHENRLGLAMGLRWDRPGV